MSNAQTSQGIKIQVGGLTAGGPYSTVAEVTSHSGPDVSVKQIDVTSYDSEARESMPSLPDYGECACTSLFVANDPAQQQLQADADGQVRRYYQFLYSDGTTSDEFQAYVTKLSRKGGVDKAVELSFSLKVTGKPTRVFAA